MRSIERRFKNIAEKKPFMEFLYLFCGSHKGQKFTKPMISLWFSKLVEKDDYSKSDKNQLLKQLENLSNATEDTHFRG